MNETSLSLLHRLRQSSDSETWDRLVGLYVPLLKVWLRKYGVQDSDADDLVQEVLVAVSSDVTTFDRTVANVWLCGGVSRSWQAQNGGLHQS